jgi:hypothetical protein
MKEIINAIAHGTVTVYYQAVGEHDEETNEESQFILAQVCSQSGKTYIVGVLLDFNRGSMYIMDMDTYTPVITIRTTGATYSIPFPNNNTIGVKFSEIVLAANRLKKLIKSNVQLPKQIQPAQ